MSGNQVGKHGAENLPHLNEVGTEIHEFSDCHISEAPLFPKMLFLKTLLDCARVEKAHSTPMSPVLNWTLGSFPQST